MKKIFFEHIIPSTKNGYIEVPIYNEILKKTDKYMSLNIGTLDYSNNNLLNIVLENNKQLNNKIK